MGCYENLNFVAPLTCRGFE